RAHAHHRGLGRALLRHQLAPIDPGGLGPQADLDHPEYRRPGPGDARRTGRAGRRGPARYTAPAGAAAARGASTGAAGAAVAIRRTSRGPGDRPLRLGSYAAGEW